QALAAINFLPLAHPLARPAAASHALLTATGTAATMGAEDSAAFARHDSALSPPGRHTRSLRRWFRALGAASAPSVGGWRLGSQCLHDSPRRTGGAHGF